MPGREQKNDPISEFRETAVRFLWKPTGRMYSEEVIVKAGLKELTGEAVVAEAAQTFEFKQ